MNAHAPTIARSARVPADPPSVVWYALRVAPQRELVAARILRDDGFTTFVPLKHIKTRARQNDPRQRLRAVARVPGYLFVGFPLGLDPPWLQLFRVAMVLGVIGQDGRPYPIPPMIMFRHVLPLAQRPQPWPRGTRRRFRSRNWAEIVSGPYEGKTVRVTGNLEELYEAIARARS